MDNAELEELYKMVILDHARKPRNFREITNASASAIGDNPSCGDQIQVQIRFDPSNDIIEDVAFTGEGCSICMASASMMTNKIKKKHSNEVMDIYNKFHRLVTELPDSENESQSDEFKNLSKALGDLSLLRGVRRFPQRVKCATLAWQALKEALSNRSADASTLK